MKNVFRVLGVLLLVVVLLAGSGFAYLKFALPNVGPAPELKIAITPARIERGQYLANSVMVCVDCHSPHDATKLQSPLSGPAFSGQFWPEPGFPPGYIAPALTPAHLNSWTDGEIYRAITSGVSKDGHALHPLMPYQAYASADPEDIQAIIAYLRSLPPSGQDRTNQVSYDFPFSLIINTLPAKPTPQKRPDPTNELAYGQYLVTTIGCAHCHVQRDEHNTPIAGTEFTGGMRFDLPAGGVAYSANLTPDMETGLGRWTQSQFLARFKAYEHPADSIAAVPGDGNQAMPWRWLSQMKEQDLRAIYTYLQSLKPVRHAIPPASATAPTKTVALN